MKRKIFLFAALLPCLLFTVVAIALSLKNESKPLVPGFDDHFVTSYVNYTMSVLNLSEAIIDAQENNREITEESFPELRAVLLENYQVLNQYEYDDEIDEAEAANFAGWPGLPRPGLIQPAYDNCIYHCVRRHKLCIDAYGDSPEHHLCNLDGSNCIAQCKSTHMMHSGGDY